MDRAAHVGVWSVNGDGTIEQLFPNAWERDFHFKAGEERAVPQTETEAVESKGLDWVLVQASEKPWSPDHGQLHRGYRFFSTDLERGLWSEERGFRLRPRWALAEAVLKVQVEPK